MQRQGSHATCSISARNLSRRGCFFSPAYDADLPRRASPGDGELMAAWARATATKAQTAGTVCQIKYQLIHIKGAAESPIG